MKSLKKIYIRLTQPVHRRQQWREADPTESATHFPPHGLQELYTPSGSY